MAWHFVFLARVHCSDNASSRKGQWEVWKSHARTDVQKLFTNFFLINVNYSEQQYFSMQPTVGAVSDIDENASVTDQVIASMLSKLTGNSSGDSSSVFISAIEHTANQETEL